jgi:hypothetical protein
MIYDNKDVLFKKPLNGQPVDDAGGEVRCSFFEYPARAYMQKAAPLGTAF